jgi:hypothetical protein
MLLVRVLPNSRFIVNYAALRLLSIYSNRKSNLDNLLRRRNFSFHS